MFLFAQSILIYYLA